MALAGDEDDVAFARDSDRFRDGLTATGNLNLRFTPSTGSGSAEPSGSIMLNIDILQLLGQ